MGIATRKLMAGKWGSAARKGLCALPRGMMGVGRMES